MTWAFSLDLRPSSLKFVLIALADHAGDDGLLWPSIDALAAKTSQDRKTVISNIAELESIGFLEDTGKRTGVTKQVKVYRLVGFDTGTTHYTYRLTNEETGQFYIGVRTCPGSPENDSGYMGSGSWPLAMARKKTPLTKTVIGVYETREQANLAEAQLIAKHASNTACMNSSGKGTVPKTDGNSPVFPTKQSRFSVGTVPKTVHGTIIEPSSEPSINRHVCDEPAMEQSIQAEYPKFSGRQDWITAIRAACNLVSEGEATPADLVAGVKRYAAYVAAGGVSEQRYVMTPAKFFTGADRPWRQEWQPPPKKLSAMDRIYAATGGQRVIEHD